MLECKILKLGLLLAGALAASGCHDFTDNSMEISRKSEMARLDLNDHTTIFQRADMDNDGDEDIVVAGNLKTEPKKTAVYLLDNMGLSYGVICLHDEIPIRLPAIRLYDDNQDGLLDISARSKLKGHFKRFKLINKVHHFVLE